MNVMSEQIIIISILGVPDLVKPLPHLIHINDVMNQFPLEKKFSEVSAIERELQIHQPRRLVLEPIREYIPLFQRYLLNLLLLLIAVVVRGAAGAHAVVVKLEIRPKRFSKNP